MTFGLDHAPFWAVPGILICLQYGFLYFKKRQRPIGVIFFIGSIICLIPLIMYIVYGGPVAAGEKFYRTIYDILFHH